MYNVHMLAVFTQLLKRDFRSFLR